MKIAIASLKSKTPYSQSKFYQVEKKEKESPADYEERTWRERMHLHEKTGNVFIPPTAFKNCIAEAAKYLSRQIPGKGKSTYTKHFEAGICVQEPLILNIKRDDVEGQWVHVPSDGMRGGTKRVSKCFGIIREWSGNVEFIILDDTITQDVFLYHLQEAGNLIGIGRFRPRNNGYYGRFEVVKLKWMDQAQNAAL